MSMNSITPWNAKSSLGSGVATIMKASISENSDSILSGLAIRSFNAFRVKLILNQLLKPSLDLAQLFDDPQRAPLANGFPSPNNSHLQSRSQSVARRLMMREKDGA